MATERDKEREAELESAMYTNCLLLGLDPAVLGIGASANANGSSAAPAVPRVGHFRHSNPRMGEQLLYFLLSSLRGPVQSAKDFDKVWPIFDSAQSRDFRKIVQGIISELESQGALPRSNSRVSSLATCCGPRFVELLWQLSVHALREVHRRTFAADVASNPLPASLTDVSYSHAAALLPVSKARIALERRKFLKNANIAVHRQATWSNLAHEMTAEFRGLCAEEAYLQQELEKLQDLRNKAKLDGELWDDRVVSSSGQTSHLVSKATRLWESLFARKGQQEVLASGPIEDLIAHREHRYRISGSSLRAAMDHSSQVPHSDIVSASPSHLIPSADGRDQIDVSHFQGNNDPLCQADDKSGRVHPTVDVAEVLRRWTHALQRIHKQSLHLAKSNDGEGPELLQCASDAGSSGHAESLAATLAEHKQHLVSIQGLINQLKEAVPAMQKSISDLTDEVNSISPLVPTNDYDGRSTSPIQAQISGRTNQEHGTDEISEVTSKLSSVQLEKASAIPALKLPQLFSLTHNSSGKGAHTPKRPIGSQGNQPANLSERKPSNQPLQNDHMGHSQEGDDYHIQNIRRSVREAALSMPSNNGESLPRKNSYDGSQHFFMPLSTSGVSQETDMASNRRKQRLFFATPGTSLVDSSADDASNVPSMSKLDELQGFPKDSDEINYNNHVNGLDSSGQRMYSDFDEDMGQVLSPPLLMESSLFTDAYEDLLAPLSETDAALMDR